MLRALPAFNTIALCLTTLALPCRSMIVATGSAGDDADRVRQVITQRLASEMSPDNARRAIHVALSPMQSAIETIKRAGSQFTHGNVESDAEIEFAANARRGNYAALGFIIACPLAVVFFVVWVTRMAMASRRRERLNFSKTIRVLEPPPPKDSSSEPKKTPPTRKMTREEFVAMRASRAAQIHVEKSPDCKSPTPLPG